MADAHGSGPCVGNNMRVQVPYSALDLKLFMRNHEELFFSAKEKTFEKNVLTSFSVFDNIVKSRQDSCDGSRKCRNWQTSKTKDLVMLTSCGFKSHLPHEQKGSTRKSWSFFRSCGRGTWNPRVNTRVQISER